MPKIIELTVEIDIQRVSCPGVWLCQDGRVSLTVFALGTSYQTCFLPPIFPLMFKDVFYFRKRFQETCALNNICCLLKDETIYCELVQWCDDCASNECVILAQYLGAMNDVLFPPNMCSTEGVDLLMRRSKDFPGILSPKIEIATKVRIDEVWNQQHNGNSPLKVNAYDFSPREDGKRQKQVCHTSRYHRPVPKSCNPRSPRPTTPRRSHRSRDYCVYNVHTQSDFAWRTNAYTGHSNDSEYDDNIRRSMSSTENAYSNICDDERQPKTILESRYIDHDRFTDTSLKNKTRKYSKVKVSPCICEICKRYHELFHMKSKGG